MEDDNEIRPGYKLTKIGWIPDEWVDTKVGAVCNCIVPSRNKPKIFDGDIPWITMPYMSNCSTIYKSDLFLSLDEIKKSGAKIVPEGSVIMSCVGELGIVSIAGVDIVINQQLHAFIPPVGVDNYFLMLVLSVQKKQIYEIATTTAVPYLNKDNCNSLLIPLPPLPEQKKIAEILSTWDTAIEQNQKLITQLKQRKKGLMQQLLTGKTRLKGFSEEWKVVKLDELFTQRNETKMGQLPLLSIGKNGVYPQDESIKKDTSNSDKSKYKRICVGDIGYNTMRMWQGRSALSNLEGVVSPAYTIVTPKCNTDPLYFSYLFKLDYVVHHFYRHSQGLVSDTWQCRFKDFATVKVDCPPTMEEQQAIAMVISTADNEISMQQKYVAQLQAQKKGLMQQLLTGQKRVNVN